MEPTVRNRYLAASIGTAAAFVALVILPFAGFTEKAVYYYSFEVTGIGTWGDGLNVFEYPKTIFYVSLLLLLGAALLISPLRLAWSAYRHGNEPTTAKRSVAARVCAIVALGTAAALLLTMFVLSPAEEEGTIWLTESGGFLDDWWPSYGAFVAIVGAGAGWWALRRVGSPAAPPPPPPPPPQ